MPLGLGIPHQFAPSVMKVLGIFFGTFVKEKALCLPTAITVEGMSRLLGTRKRFGRQDAVMRGDTLGDMGERAIIDSLRKSSSLKVSASV